MSLAAPLAGVLLLIIMSLAAPLAGVLLLLYYYVYYIIMSLAAPLAGVLLLYYYYVIGSTISWIIIIIILCHWQDH